MTENEQQTHYPEGKRKQNRQNYKLITFFIKTEKHRMVQKMYHRNFRIDKAMF